MDIFGVLTMIGGLAMFLYGMNAMGDGLAKLSGGKLEQILEKLTSKRIMAVLLGVVEFVEKFREEIPRYMVKHQVRPGMTGWAQINGYRGNTSIRKRIEYDLYYIENWTVGLDIKILFLTVFKGFVNKNAY